MARFYRRNLRYKITLPPPQKFNTFSNCGYKISSTFVDLFARFSNAFLHQKLLEKPVFAQIVSIWDTILIYVADILVCFQIIKLFTLEKRSVVRSIWTTIITKKTMFPQIAHIIQELFFLFCL